MHLTLRQADCGHSSPKRCTRGYRHLARTINYRAKQFLEMVTLHGGVGAAQALLRGRDASDGFTRLWEENKLEWSVEASVLRSKYASLFTDAELDTARRRLTEHGFDVGRIF